MKRFLLLTIILLSTGGLTTRVLAQIVYNDELVQKAKNGDAKAQNTLFWCHWDGNGVTKDYTSAVYWHIRAAEQDNAMAQYSPAKCYANGRGVTKDKKLANYWMKQAANAKDDEAVRLMSFFFESNAIMCHKV